MIKDIHYAGYSTEPSDYECADGQMATSINLINEDSQLKPVFQPAEMAELPDNYIIVYIHDANTFTHYILHNTSTNRLYWIDESVVTEAVSKPVSSTVIAQELTLTNPSHELHSFGTAEIYSVNGIGNTLVVLTSDGMHYILWKGATDGYLYLGTHLPELPISFGLQGEVVRTDTFTISFNSISESNIWDEFSDENKTTITNQVLAKVNKFIADHSTNKGKFIFPFLVRYAYRLYDGSLTMHSAPVLMVCSSDLMPQVFWEHITGHGSYTDAQLRIVGVEHTLDYAVVLSSRIQLLQQWEDIVRSVDIFISKPIYTYDQNGQCTRFAQSSDIDSFCICKHTNQSSSLSTSTYPLRYQVNTFNKLYAFTYNPTTFTYPAGRLMIPQRSTDQVKADIRSCSQFYFLKSIKINELSTTRTAVAIEEDYLQSLVAREAMTDDYDSHDTLIPRYSFGYNSRLNIANIKKKLYDTFNMGALCCYTDGYVANYSSGSPTMLDDKITWGVFFFIKQDGRDIIVQGETFLMSSQAKVLFLYYPNVNAYKAVFYNVNYFTYGYEVPLEAHGFLNGAFYFGGWDNSTNSTSTPSASSEQARTIEVPNKIYTSEVNNPFHFPVLGINTVGTGTILGISAAAKAMSQGQFGQFPLYAFTTEGVWALEVSGSGSFSARQPITRDVCINTDSITQIDSSVLFATDRGIMLISGSQTECLTDSIFAEQPFDVLDLPCIDQLHSKLGHGADTCLPVKPFLGFLAGCRMVYDYIHQRIIVFNPTTTTTGGVTTQNYTYAYVFSLKSKMWGMIFSRLKSTINSYPEAMAMTHANKLVSFRTTDETISKGLFVTRPLKLEAPDIHKTISALIQRGHFERGDVGTVLYGSRDLYTWRLVWSSKDQYLRGFRGTPYKYFRIAGLTELTDGKSVFGASVTFEPRHTNNLR